MFELIFCVITVLRLGAAKIEGHNRFKSIFRFRPVLSICWNEIDAAHSDTVFSCLQTKPRLVVRKEPRVAKPVTTSIASGDLETTFDVDGHVETVAGHLSSEHLALVSALDFLTVCLF